ncbi:hypothetical protein AZE42_02238 [Rhizopogon vesiculosus]|uniref:BTB domain-containing protein n=1 Tax=Rhizopogon vesiculosus TaxID=180088 RepID=A0A1J8Q453_9AGAM|nr:hypothetical protein AZE42_02238 [Rhizopogon vesiculosus]
MSSSCSSHSPLFSSRPCSNFPNQQLGRVMIQRTDSLSFRSPVQEDGKTLDIFLRFFYPSTLSEDRSFESLIGVMAVLTVARKYSLDLLERKVCKALVDPKFLLAEPLSCFAIARYARFEHETMIAARYTLREPLIPARFLGIDLTTASDLLASLTYHQRCSIAVEPLRPSQFTRLQLVVL